MKKFLTALAFALPLTAFAGTTTRIVPMPEAGPSQQQPCWVQLTVNTAVDGRRIVAFEKDQGRVIVYVGAATAYSGVGVTEKDDASQDAYIADIKQRISNCYK